MNRQRQDLIETPAVSVIIPTYNSRELLTEALDALATQGLPPAAMEVIVVDDGSTDGTWEMLCQRQQAQPNLHVLRQPNSGRPSVGRNRGLEQATGRYLFFNDADDYFAPDALRRLVTFADEARSDVVIGRVRRIGPTEVLRPFGGIVIDADLIKDKVWMSLGPMKLFRRDLVERLGLRFPEDMVQGEDQIFVASCLFAAKRVSVLRDYDYYYRRIREDNQNVSRQSQTLTNKLLTTTRMTRLIVSHTAPGSRREYFMRRVLVGTLGPALNKPFEEANDVEQRQFLATVQAEVLPHLTENMLHHASPSRRMRLLVARDGTAEDLSESNRVLRDGLRYRVDEGVLTYDLGPRLNRRLAPVTRAVRPLPQLKNRLRSVDRVPLGHRLTAQVDLGTLPVDSVELVATWNEGDVTTLRAEAPPSGGTLSMLITPAGLRTCRRLSAQRGQRQVDLVLRARFRGVTVASSRVSCWDPAEVRSRNLSRGPANQRAEDRLGNPFRNSGEALTLMLAEPHHRLDQIRRRATRRVTRLHRLLSRPRHTFSVISKAGLGHWRQALSALREGHVLKTRKAQQGATASTTASGPSATGTGSPQ